MTLYDMLKRGKVYLDGGLGTMLQNAGLKPGVSSEQANLLFAERVKDIHTAYFNAGSNIVCANTFGANALKYGDSALEELIESALSAAKAAKNESAGTQQKYIAMDIGSLGALIKPLGNLDFEDCVQIFKKAAVFGKKHGADLFFIETMTCAYETKAALLAVKESSSLPVFVSNAYSENGKLLTGASPQAVAALLEGMGADAIGINCSLGPKSLYGVLREYLECASLPVIFKPNAGLPQLINGKAEYTCPPSQFAGEMLTAAEMGASVLGGCCGTTPEYISALINKVKNVNVTPPENKKLTVVSSGRQAVYFDKKPVLIGERINPTGKKRLKQALIENDADYIIDQALMQQDCGAHVLDINVGVPGTNEKMLLTQTVYNVQSVCSLPLQLDTSDPAAMEAAMRCVNGKPLINSVNAKKESMESIFPLIKKYGGVCVCLTLDEKGIPETADERVLLAKKIIDEAKKYGIEKNNLIFDTLTMAVSACENAAEVTLEAAQRIKKELGCHTVLGVSNISFGLPKRDCVNSTFFTMALTKGLSAAIMNPLSPEMTQAYRAYNALTGNDRGFCDYISFAQSAPDAPEKPSDAADAQQLLKSAVIKGKTAAAAELTKKLLETDGAMDIVQNIIIPALNTVGTGFESSTVFLPQLLMSAEAAKCAFEEIKAFMSASGGAPTPKCSIVLATVKGDIHDIGKNIVKLLLENYGFKVSDLGKNVAPEEILSEVLRLDAPLLGLSALMTTTVPAMEQTIRLVHEKAPHCKIIVGGAVLNADYAEKIGADRYAADAMEAVRYAEEIDLAT